MYTKAVKTYLIVNNLLADRKGELDEKALLIALFVIAAIAGLSTLASAVSERFISLAASL
jgi:Flp pilus assembly pilin Flp